MAQNDESIFGNMRFVNANHAMMFGAKELEDGLSRIIIAFEPREILRLLNGDTAVIQLAKVEMGNVEVAIAVAPNREKMREILLGKAKNHGDVVEIVKI